MLCLGIDAPPLLVLLSDLFYKIYPVGFLAAIAAFGAAVLIGKHHRVVVAAAICALVLLLEPITFLCRMLVPLITDFDSESGGALLAFMLSVVLPLSLPILALCLVRRSQHPSY
jgi:hypothetical protein